MRVPTTTYSDSFSNDLNTLRSRQAALQSQITSGLRVTSASDDPAAMHNALNFVASKNAAKQFSANVTAAQERSTQIFNALQSLTQIVQKAGEDGTSSGGLSADKRTALVSDLNALIDHALEVANTKDPVTGAGIFGGTSGATQPFTATRDAQGHVTSVAYGGNSSVNSVEISKGNTITVDVAGTNPASSGPRGLFADAQSGADLFANLIQLRDDIAAGNSSSVTATDMPALQKVSDNLIYHVGAVGAAQTRLDFATTALQNQLSALDKNISDATSADIYQTALQLQQAQTSYQAALQSGVKIMQLSILNYIQ